jgi:zeta-carotene desaturase
VDWCAVWLAAPHLALALHSMLWLQVLRLFPSAKGLEVTWHSIVKIGQSLYNEGPGMDPFRPDQQTPVKRMFLAGSYTKQDYIDSM